MKFNNKTLFWDKRFQVDDRSVVDVKALAVILQTSFLDLSQPIAHFGLDQSLQVTSQIFLSEKVLLFLLKLL